MKPLELALEEWKKALGGEFVFADKDTLDRYARTTLASAPRALAVLKPGSTDEVKAVLKTANERGIPVYPISRGKNWGYGDACPVQEGHVIVDLSRMNRIIEVNEKLGYAVVEPGVSQGQLFEHLKANKIKLWMDCIGSGPEGSLIGNTVDRGFGHTPYGDHFANTCGMEVVLADGSLLNTGFGHFKGSKTAHLYKWGIGPYLDGIFSQSNFGIVTKMGLWLMPEPECMNVFFFSVRKEEDIAKVVEALRPLRMKGTLKSLVHMANELRTISSFKRYPWEESKGVTPLPEELRRKMGKYGLVGAWSISGALYGSRRQVALGRRELRKALRGIAMVNFVGDARMGMANVFSAALLKFFPKVKIAKELVDSIFTLGQIYRLLKGEPTKAFLYGALWRSKKKEISESLDPLENDVGIMWVSPIIPMTGEAVLDFLASADTIFKKYTFEPLITVTLITERSMVCITTIAYDKNDPAEVKQALKCYEEIYEAMFEKGYAPYRTSIATMPKLGKHSSVFFDVTKKIKTALDPNSIISRGRYEP